ncbi:MAG: PAS domain S-box protein [Deltaproteobacteria bacterium]|nr:PAS domain S-box protein [Deltaproteobacteria bacterium]
MKTRKRIFFALITLIILLVGAIGLVSAIFALHQHRQDTIGAFKLKVSTRTVEIGRLMPRNDRKAVLEILRSLVLSNRACVYALMKKDGKTFLYFPGREMPKGLSSAGAPARDAVSIREFRDHEGSVIFDLSRSVGEGGAVLHVGLSRQEMDLESRPVLVMIGVLCLCGLILGLVLTAVFSRRVTREVDRLTNGLRLSEEKFKKAFHQSPVWVVISSLEEGRYVEVNENFLQSMGYEREEVIGRTSLELGIWPDPDERKRVIRRIKEEGRVENVEIQFHTRGGDILSMLLSGEVIEFGGEKCLLSVSLDISERKRFEKELEYQKKSLESILLHSGLPIVTVDREHRVLSCNRYFEDLFQFKESELTGKNLDETLARTESMDEAGRYTQVALKGDPIHGTGKRYRKDGTAVDVEFFGVPIIVDHEHVGAYGIYIDIGKRTRLEEELRNSETLLQNTLEAIPDLLTVHDRDLRVVLSNWHGHEYIPPEERAGSPYCYQVYMHRDRPCEPCHAKEVFETGRPVRLEKTNPVDGITREINVYPVFDDAEKVVMVAEHIRDITEMTEARNALQKSEQKYRLLIENATDAIFIAQDGVIKFENPRAVEMTGYPAEELARIPFVNFIHPEDRDLVDERHLKRLKGERLPPRYPFTIINRSGEEISVELNAVLIEWEGRPATLNFLRDITEQKRLEAQFQQAQRMESLGTLAGGIAHDFNNLLMAMQGRASLLLMDKDSSHRDFEHLKGIEGYVESAAELTKQLLGFARGGKYEVRRTDLNELIQKQNQMFGRTRKEITMREKFQEDLWPVEVDRGQMEQVLLNLYVNAWHAMPGGGDLYVETENLILDETYVQPFSIEPGRYVKVSVTDTGVGMDEATRKRIFDPFFTTKEMGRGTGLGLASVYGIVKNHGGFINVYSEKGHGTTFTIYLPASEGEVDEEKEATRDLLRGSETILLIDDEPMILEVAGELLEQLGYRVLRAGGGKEAVGVYEKNSDRIDLVIVDMIMPNMGGGETYDTLREINPDVKVILSSGYSINGQAQEILNRGCDGFIQKPFKIKELSHKLRQVLDDE